MERRAQARRSRAEWDSARRRAFVREALGILTRRPVDLLPFEEVRRRLHLRHSRYLGVAAVPLDQIVGSVGRYLDFTREFLPRHGFLETRWQQVDALIHGGQEPGPVELYKVGEAYFVRDGHHRVSVARQHKDLEIQARVWEFDTRVPVGRETDIQELLLSAARTAFLEETDADRLCPGLSIVLTAPDGYTYLLYEIQGFAQSVARIDGREVSLPEAVPLWCEMVYSPVIGIVRASRTLERFPGLTEGDLYLWLRRNQEELQIRYGRDILMEEAEADLVGRLGQGLSRSGRLRQRVGRLAEGLGDLGGRLARRIAPSPPNGGELAAVSRAQLLASVCALPAQTPRLRFAGGSDADWAAWRERLRDRLWTRLGVGELPRNIHDIDQSRPHLDKAVVLDGLPRELIWLNTEDRLRLPVYVFAPGDPQARRPAILVFPGHGTIDQTAGLIESGQRANALTLARAGFVVLTMELRGFGRLGAVDHLQIDRAARIQGRTWYGLLVRDAMQAIDYLLMRPEVDQTQIGATGIGAGGALAMYLAALDDRVSAVMVNSYLSKYSLVCLDVEQCPCNDIPGLARDAEMGDVAALIAPRPALFVNGLRDPATHTRAARESFTVAQTVYRALGVPSRVRLVESDDLGHAYDCELAIAWFRRWLR